MRNDPVPNSAFDVFCTCRCAMTVASSICHFRFQKDVLCALLHSLSPPFGTGLKMLSSCKQVKCPWGERLHRTEF